MIPLLGVNSGGAAEARKLCQKSAAHVYILQFIHL